jgi:hypothetical protein
LGLFFCMYYVIQGGYNFRLLSMKCDVERTSLRQEYSNFIGCLVLGRRQGSEPMKAIQMVMSPIMMNQSWSQELEVLSVN